MSKHITVEKKAFDKTLSRLLKTKPVSRGTVKAGRKKTATIIGPKN